MTDAAPDDRARDDVPGGEARSAPEADRREQRVGILGADPPPPETPSGGPLVGQRWTNADIPRQNRLLALLPPDVAERLRSRLEPIELGFREHIWEKDAPIQYVYFPLNGVVSMVSIMEDGSTLEVGTIGNEGFVGLPVFLGGNKAPLWAFAQIPGAALRMQAEHFREEVSTQAALRDVLHLYTQALFSMLAQASACSRTHSSIQRLGLWLLLCHDRVGTDTFPLTQEFMAQMLGVRRATVTEAEARLRERGAIQVHHGLLTIRDRAALEAAACECYGVIRSEYDRLLSSNHGHSA